MSQITPDELRHIKYLAAQMGYKFVFNPKACSTHIAKDENSTGCGLSTRGMEDAQLPLLSCNGCATYARKRGIPYLIHRQWTHVHGRMTADEIHSHAKTVKRN